MHRILNLFTSYGQNRWRLVICQDRARVCLPDAPCQRALLQPFTTAFGCHTRCVSRTNPKKSGRLPATRFTLTPTTRVVIWDISTYTGLQSVKNDCNFLTESKRAGTEVARTVDRALEIWNMGAHNFVVALGFSKFVVTLGGVIACYIHNIHIRLALRVLHQLKDKTLVVFTMYKLLFFVLTSNSKFMTTRLFTKDVPSRLRSLF